MKDNNSFVPRWVQAMDPPRSPRGVRLSDLPKWRSELAAAPDAFRRAEVNRKWGAL